MLDVKVNPYALTDACEFVKHVHGVTIEEKVAIDFISIYVAWVRDIEQKPLDAPTAPRDGRV